MNVREYPSAPSAWALYSTYARLAVCLLLLPLLVTGFVIIPEARLEFVGTILIVLCCLYIDGDTVARRPRVKTNSAP